MWIWIPEFTQPSKKMTAFQAAILHFELQKRRLMAHVIYFAATVFSLALSRDLYLDAVFL